MIANEPGAVRRIAVLGEMLELGEHAERLHADSGRLVARSGVHVLYAIGGPAAQALATAAIDAGMPPDAVTYFPSSEEAAPVIARALRAGDLVLVKGSRGIRTDVVVGSSRGGARLMLYLLLWKRVSESEIVPRFPDLPLMSVLNVTRYVTFRTAAASLTALAISLVLGPWMIRKLRDFQIGQVIRQEGPESHRAKAGTPTMGGLLILSSVVIPTLLWADLQNPYVWIAVLATLGFGIVGFIDDYLKIVRRSHHGLIPRYKMGGQLLVALGVGVALLWLADQNPPHYNTRLIFPFFKNLIPDLGFMYLPFAAFILVAWSNAVNLTDGLDGLAISTFGVAAAAFTALWPM